jgi:hypothetical protein
MRPWQKTTPRRFASGVEATLHIGCADGLDRREATIADNLQRKNRTTFDDGASD